MGEGWILIACGLLATPFVALAFAISARIRAREADRAARDLKQEVDSLMDRLIRHEQRIARLEQGSPGIPAAGAAGPLRDRREPIPPPPAMAVGRTPSPRAEVPDQAGIPLSPLPPPVAGGGLPPEAPPAKEPIAPAAEPPVILPVPPAPHEGLPPEVVRKPAPAFEPAAAPPPFVPRPAFLATEAEEEVGGRAPKEGGWERRLGIALPVWIGAVALILSGAFLVKYSVERGWLGPGARVTLAVLLGMALLGAGEWLRKRTAMTAQGASAAGVAVLYAAFLAGTILYHLISPWAGFSLLALTTAAAVGLSLRQGMVVAVLGLVGGFFTPYWIGVVSASPARLFAYLLMLQAALILVTRKRRWNALAALTLVMGLGAAFHRLASGTVAADAPWIGLFLLVSAGAFLLAARGWAPSPIPQESGGLGTMSALLGYGALIGAFVVLAILAARTRFGLMEWAFLGILAGASLALGRLDAAYDRMPWVSFGVTILLAGGWVAQSAANQRADVWIVAAGMALVYGFGAWVAHHGSRLPASWATLSAAGGLAAFGLAWWVDKLHGTSVAHWGTVSLALAVLYLAASVSAASPTRRSRYGEATLAAFCVAVTAFVSLTVPLELETHWLTVAWALEAGALAWLLLKLRVKALGYLGLLLGAAVAVRLLLNPEVLRYPLGSLPVLNWILYGYGIPVVAFALAAYWYERADWKPEAGAFTWGAAALLFALLTLEVRQGFHPGRLAGPLPRIVEWATYSHLWLAAGLIALTAFLKWRKTAVGLAGLAFMGLAAGKILLFDCLLANPLWTPDHVGAIPVLNWLLYVYALPALGFTAAAWLLGRSHWDLARNAAAAAATVLAMVFLVAEVRQAFHPSGLPGAGPSLVEWGTYSAVILSAGLLLLLAYVRWGRETVRNASVAFFLVAVVKIGLVDVLSANPLWNHSPVGPWPLLNWLLYVYGLPALLLALVQPAWRRDRQEAASLLAVIRSAAVILAWACLSLEVRQLFHGPFLDSGRFTLMEVSTYTNLWLVMAAGLLLAWVRWRGGVELWGARLLYGMATVKLVLLDVLLCSPLLWHQDVGGLPVLNGLLYVYGLPIFLLALVARVPAGESWRSVAAPSALYGGLGLGLLLLTLEVRQFFHPHFLDGGGPTDVENYAYSAAWILFALLLLGVGILKQGKGPRVASLAVMFLAVTKVFVYDLRHLQDLYRVGSFLALGLSLLFISYLYQRFVFAEVSRA